MAVTGHCEGQPVLQPRLPAPGDAIWVTGEPTGAAAAGLRLTCRARASCRGGAEPATSPGPRPSHRPSRGRHLGSPGRCDGHDRRVRRVGRRPGPHQLKASGCRPPLGISQCVAAGATLEEALGGGEDFVLAFCDPETAPIEEAFRGLDAPIRVGRCTEDATERTLGGRTIVVPGWEHQW